MKTNDVRQAADPRIADLVRAGKLRVALFLPQYTKDPVTGEIRGQYAGIVMVQIAHAVAARLGVEVQMVGHPTPPAAVDCTKAGACDVTLLGINPSRAAEGLYASTRALSLHLSGAGWLLNPKCRRCRQARGSRCGREQSRINFSSGSRNEARRTS